MPHLAADQATSSAVPREWSPALLLEEPFRQPPGLPPLSFQSLWTRDKRAIGEREEGCEHSRGAAE